MMEAANRIVELEEEQKWHVTKNEVPASSDIEVMVYPNNYDRTAYWLESEQLWCGNYRGYKPRETFTHWRNMPKPPEEK